MIAVEDQQAFRMMWCEDPTNTNKLLHNPTWVAQSQLKFIQQFIWSAVRLTLEITRVPRKHSQHVISCTNSAINRVNSSPPLLSIVFYISIWRTQLRFPVPAILGALLKLRNWTRLSSSFRNFDGFSGGLAASIVRAPVEQLLLGNRLMAKVLSNSYERLFAGRWRYEINTCWGVVYIGNPCQFLTSGAFRTFPPRLSDASR